MKKILTIRLGAVGDVLTVLPAVAAVRAMFPDAVIHHLVEAPAAPLLQGFRALDDLVVVQRKQIQTAAKRLNLAPLLTLRRQLAEAKYDLVIDFQGLMRSAWLAHFTNAAVRISKRNWKEMNPPFFTETVVPESNDNVVLQHLDLLRPLHPNRQRPALVHACPQTGGVEEAAAQAALALAKVDGPFVVVSPGSKWPQRAWPESLTVAVMKLLHTQGLNPLLVGGPNEDYLTQLGAAHDWPVSIDLSLRGLAALIGRARGFVGADSGPMHLADLLRIPSVVVFGPSAPQTYGPMFARHKSFRDPQFHSEHDFRGRSGVPYFSNIDAVAVVGALYDLMRVPSGVV